MLYHKHSSLFVMASCLASLLLATSLHCESVDSINGKPAVQKASASSQPVASPPQKWHQQAKSRSARSLSDMFEKVKSKIFGSKKSQQSQQVAPSASQPASAIQSPNSVVNSAQRQPWDVNSYNQQFSPYTNQASSNGYQWPVLNGANSAFINGQFSNQLGGFSSLGSAAYPGLSQSSSGPSMMSSGSDGSLQSAGSSQVSSNQAVPQSNGILSSASHLISQYLSPGSAGSQQQQVNGPNSGSSGLPANQAAAGQQQQTQSLMSPNQQSQYNEFASMLDSMVAQTGLSQGQRPQTNMFQGSPMVGAQSNGIQGQQGISGQVPTNGMSQSNSFQGNNMMSMGDQEMMSSSNVQILAQPGAPNPLQSSPSAVSGSSAGAAPVSPSAAMQPQASQKSSMVNLAEQLAPGAQFNKLISFPFSLSNNDDPNKEGRFKLHIPFLNQHVKRSDQQQLQQASQKQQQQPQAAYYAQHYAPALAQQIPLNGASLQSPSVSVSSSSSSSSSSVAAPASSISTSAQVAPSSSLLSASIPASSSAVQQSRPNWSVADIQSSSSSSKMIPIQHSVASDSSISVASVSSS